ncbi:MAG: hypothetical protein IT184_16735 [Acidobacteria bacterium]|nr:hypothetical protein [Acidobacteriota bacterium]
MQANELPRFDPSDNETGCCPRFHPEPWENQDLHFDRKPFVRASTISLFHVPLNMGSVFSRTWTAIQQAHADTGGFLVLSRDEGPWHAEHLFAVDRPVPGAQMVELSGDFMTRVFEGPYSEARTWCDQMTEHVRAKGKALDSLYFFYTTCPRCAKHYGKNYVVGVAQVH